ncbi:MAG: Pyrrolo-quinoline quinone repeat-containing protein [Chthoniobacteraceae bacterium]|nr:Pyrrolo-quinoline quinone repeat-containing protein [Chthoniobacteraceae bacterium]
MKTPIASTLAFTFVLAATPLHAAKNAEAAPPAAKAGAPVHGWLDWRGPTQNSVSLEKGLPDKVDAKKALWTADFPGQSAPVIANGKVYIMGFEGEGPELQEGVACFDAETGKVLWKQLFNDFLSDVVYLRYANSSPTIDPETGNVYIQNSSGIFAAFTGDGKPLWKHSMMEDYGRMTFPNNRTASPLIDQDLVITRGITAAWGAYGPPGDRFYAFDKKTGELVWSSAPGALPQDNTFSHPWLGFHNGMRVLYSAAGDSSVLSLNARTGEPLWRTPVAKAGAKGGINAAVLEYKGNIIVIHESENIDTSDVGRMAAFKIPSEIKPPNPQTPQVFETKELEVWRNPVGSLASSPILVGDRIYEVTGTGDLAAVDANDGKVLWRKKLGIEQRQSTPFYADGKIYLAMYVAAASGQESAKNESVGDGELLILKPNDKDVEILSRTVLTGKCYGSPVGYNGKLYMQTEKKLYCFGTAGANKGVAPDPAPEKFPAPGPKAKLQVIPYEVLLAPGSTQSFRVRALDANGFTVEENIDPKSVKWESYVPPTALVKAAVKGAFNAKGELVADKENTPSAGQFQASLGELKGYVKGRVLPDVPLTQDFEKYELNQDTSKPPAPAVPNTLEPATPFAYPPLPWNAARFKFEVREKDGNKALCKTIDNKRLQRGTIFINRSDLKNYTIEADVLSEGNKRKMSEVGVIAQRYQIVLKGNAQTLEVTSNQELLRQSVPFKWSPNEWYHIKARVDVAADGSGVVRGKAWKKGDPEPEAWTIEVPHKRANEEGSPGLFSFTPQEQRAWIDNVSVTAN